MLIEKQEWIQYYDIWKKKKRQSSFVRLTPSFSFSIKIFFKATNLLLFLSLALNTSLNYKKKQLLLIQY